MLGEHRQPGRARIAAFEQQVDDRGMDLPASGGRQLGRGELADLLVGERVVRGLAGSLGEQEARLDGGREIVGQLVGLAGRHWPTRPRPARSEPGSPGGRAG